MTEKKIKYFGNLKSDNLQRADELLMKAKLLMNQAATEVKKTDEAQIYEDITRVVDSIDSISGACVKYLLKD